MKTCYIVSAMPFSVPIVRNTGDIIIAADAGHLRLRERGYTPDLTVGDFDSSDAPTSGEVLRRPVRKDDTDTVAAVREGLLRGYRRFVLLGAMGGGSDHTYANLQVLALLKRAGATAKILTEREEITLLSAGDRLLFRAPTRDRRLSLFAYGGEARVTLRGLSYEGEEIVLTPDFPLGVGNLFCDCDAEILIHAGDVLLFSEEKIYFEEV